MVHSKEYMLNWRLRNPKLTMLARAKCRAKRDGLEFNLSLDDFDIPEVCPILGVDIKTNKGRMGWFNDSPSLDRIYIDKGYVKGNVRVISNRANRLKCDASLEELEKIVLDARMHRY